jgi:signal transduction histidine kinase
VIIINGRGERVPFEVVTSPIRNQKGEIVGIQGISRDIRDRKRAEEAQRKAYGELEKRVEERTAELRDAKAQAELYLVRKLVEDFRGNVWVEDRVKDDFRQGSRFVVLLPAAGAQPQPG